MEKDEFSQIEKEYSVQLFGFDPSILVEEIKEESILDITDLLAKVKTQILTKKAGKFDKEELEKGMAALELKYKHQFEKKFGVLANHLDQNIFKVPSHVLLKEDVPWDYLTQSAGKSQLLALTMEMEKMRAKYKTCLYKKAYLRNYLDKLKSVCVHQEETIQQEVGMKEKYGLVEFDETLGFLSSHTKLLGSKQRSLEQLSQGGGKRKPEHETNFTREKRPKMDKDLEQYVDTERSRQIALLQ